MKIPSYFALSRLIPLLPSSALLSAFEGTASKSFWSQAKVSCKPIPVPSLRRAKEIQVASQGLELKWMVRSQR